jgi:hypothetical protein
MAIASEVSIYVKRDDLIMGPFSEEQTVKRYHRGEFRDSDLAMIDGMTGWHPLATYIVDETDDAPPTFDASAPPPIPQNEPPPRFDLGEEPRSEPVADRARRSFEFANPVGAAWALLSLGVVVMILSRWPFLLWVPLILAAIALAVQQLARRNYVHAGPLLAVALLAPWFVWSQWLAPARPHVAKPTTPAPSTPARVVVVASPTPRTDPPKVVVETPAATPAPPAQETAPEPAPAPPALKFEKGDYVALTANTKLLFEGKEFRLGKAGERFQVLKATPEAIFLATKTARGQIIAVTASPDVLKSAPPPPATPVRPHIIE